MSISLVFAAVALIFLMLLSAAEAAVLALTPQTRQRLRGEDGRTGRILRRLTTSPGQYLLSLHFGMTLSLLALTLIVADQTLERLEAEGVWLTILVLSPLILVFGQLLPRALAGGRAESTLRPLVPLIQAVHILFTPLRWPVQRLGGLLVDQLPDDSAVDARLAESRFKVLVDLGQQEGALQESERELIHKVFAFNDMRVSEAMTPRTEVVGFSITTAVDQILQGIKAQRFARVPIYKGTLDNILGILYTKDLLGMRARRETQRRHLKDLLHPVHFVPETKKADELLREFQTSKSHFAVVVDEYGGVSGVVTMDDLLGAIFGTILDEHDEEATDITALGPSEWRAQASVDLETLGQTIGVYLPEEEEVTTLGGLVMASFGSLPDPGDTIVHEGLEFTVERREGSRLLEIRIRRLRDPGDFPASPDEESA